MILEISGRLWAKHADPPTSHWSVSDIPVPAIIRGERCSASGSTALWHGRAAAAAGESASCHRHLLLAPAAGSAVPGPGLPPSTCFSSLGFSCGRRRTDRFVAAEQLMDSQAYPFTQSTIYLGSSAKKGVSPWKKPNSLYSMPCIDRFFFKSLLVLGLWLTREWLSPKGS